MDSLPLLIVVSILSFASTMMILVQVGMLFKVNSAMNEVLTLARINNNRAEILERQMVLIHSMLTMGWNNQGSEDTPDPRQGVTSLEDLIQRITDDPTFQKRNPEEIERLRNLFEHPDDDEPDNNEPWKRQ